MPLYQYQCPAGHSQDLLRAIAVRDEAVACDDCGAPAVRAVAAPRLAVLSTTNRRAHERNERSAHEPKRYSRPAATEEPPRKAAGGGRSPGHAHSHGPSRPWMLGH